MEANSDNTKQTGGPRQDAFASVLNIPKKFKIADLRAFFSDFIERERFQIFHYLHSPETSDNKQLDTCKCLVQLKTLRDLNEFITRYNSKLWIDKAGQKLDSMCVIEKVNAPISTMHLESTNVAEEPEASVNTKFLSLKERRALLDKKKRVATNDTVNLELVAPAGLPHGNVGTSRREIKRAVDRCTLPTSVLKGLGIQQKALSDKLFGAVPLNYRELKAPKGHVAVDYVDHPLDYYKEVNKGKKSRKRRRTEIEDNYIDRDSDDSSGEEWDRYQAIHEDDNEEATCMKKRSTSRGTREAVDSSRTLMRCTGTVLKFKVLAVVFVQRSIFDNKLAGDDDERDVDDWDMKLSAKRERRASHNDVPRRPRKQFKFTPRANQISTSTAQTAAGINVETAQAINDNVRVETSAGMSIDERNQPGPKGDIGAFEKHNKGTASKIMAKMGWNYGQGIGPKGREGIAEPIQLDANLATYGLGYKPVQVPKRSNQNQRPFIPTIYDNDYYTPTYVSNPGRDTVSIRSVNGVKQRLISFEQGEVIDANGIVVNKKRGPDEVSESTNKIEALVAYDDTED